MDDIFALGPAAAVFPAVKRFGEAVKASLNLEMQVSKLECFSPEYNLSHCPWREALGAPAAERFLDRSTPGGGRERGFFQMLAPLFGHGAFESPYPNLTRTALASRASSRAAPPTSTRSARSWGS